MKITPEHYQYLKNAIAEVAIQQPIATYRQANPLFNETRIRWDYLWMSAAGKASLNHLYDYLNDAHIDTALRHIMSELESEAK